MVLCICVRMFCIVCWFLVLSIVLLKLNSVLVDSCSGCFGSGVGVSGVGGRGGLSMVVYDFGF